VHWVITCKSAVTLCVARASFSRHPRHAVDMLILLKYLHTPAARIIGIHRWRPKPKENRILTNRSCANTSDRQTEPQHHTMSLRTEAHGWPCRWVAPRESQPERVARLSYGRAALAAMKQAQAREFGKDSWRRGSRNYRRPNIDYL